MWRRIRGTATLWPMPVRALTLAKEPAEKGVYETDEIVQSELAFASTYRLIVDVPLSDATDPSKSFSAELLHFDGKEWVVACGTSFVGQTERWRRGALDAAGNRAPDVLLPPLTRLDASSVRQREGADPNTGQFRRLKFDLLHGQPIKARITMPSLIDLAVSVEDTQDGEAVKAVIDKDGKPDGGVALDVHHSIAVVDTTSATGAGTSATSASHSISAGNAAAMIANGGGDAAGSLTLVVTGSHTFADQVIHNAAEGSGTWGASAGKTIHNSAGTTGTTTVTNTGFASNGCSFTIWELSGVETSWSGVTAEGSLATGHPNVPITTTVNGCMIFGGALDTVVRGTFTAANDSTVSHTYDPGGANYAEWRSTDPVLSGTFGSAGLGFDNRDWNSVALAMVPVTGTAALTGTATSSITETDIVASGKTLIATLTDTKFVANGVARQIVYVGSQVGGFAGTTSAQTITFALTGGTATTPAAGDLVIVTYIIGSTVTRTPIIENTSGTDYTTMGSALTQSDNFDCNQLTAYRFMPGTPETQVRLTETGGGTGNAADAGRYTIHVFRNVDLSTPMDVAVVTAGAANSSTVNPGSITPSTAGAIIYIGGGAASATGSTMTATYLYGRVSGSTADTNDASVLAGFRPWTSGAYDGAAFGTVPGGTTANSWTCVTAALRPATTNAFDDARAAALAGIDSAQAEGTGWDALIKSGQAVTALARTSDTVGTDTLAAYGTYDITAQETVTWTIPASIVEGGAIVVSPSFTIDTAAGGPTVAELASAANPYIQPMARPKTRVIAY